VRIERCHAEPPFGDLGGGVVLRGRQRGLDLAEGEQVIAHVGPHVLLHHSRHGHRLPGVVSCRCWQRKQR
jgi:hypothetical protein